MFYKTVDLLTIANKNPITNPVKNQEKRHNILLLSPGSMPRPSLPIAVALSGASSSSSSMSRSLKDFKTEKYLNARTRLKVVVIGAVAEPNRQFDYAYANISVFTDLKNNQFLNKLTLIKI